MTLPTVESEMAYEIGQFEDNYDRQPTEDEKAEIRRGVEWKVHGMLEAYGEWCAVRGRVPSMPMVDGSPNGSMGG